MENIELRPMMEVTWESILASATRNEGVNSGNANGEWNESLMATTFFISHTHSLFLTYTHTHSLSIYLTRNHLLYFIRTTQSLISQNLCAFFPLELYGLLSRHKLSHRKAKDSDNREART